MRRLIVIPYLAKEAQGRELDYAVKGWRTHFKEPYHIVVVGDWNKVVESGKDISFIPCPQIPDTGVENYRPHLDHINKFRAVREKYPDSYGFIYTTDDVYAVNDFTMADILMPKIVSRDMGGDAKSPNGWKRDLARTRETCVENNLPLWNWVCHLPVYYDWRKLLNVYDLFGCDNRSYIVENLYFNLYCNGVNPVLIEGNNSVYKYCVNNTHPNVEELRRALKEKIWINNTPDGYRSDFDNVMYEHFFGKQ